MEIRRHARELAIDPFLFDDPLNFIDRGCAGIPSGLCMILAKITYQLLELGSYDTPRLLAFATIWPNISCKGVAMRTQKRAASQMRSSRFFRAKSYNRKAASSISGTFLSTSDCHWPAGVPARCNQRSERPDGCRDSCCVLCPAGVVGA
jgi:hypothetical protein